MTSTSSHRRSIGVAVFTLISVTPTFAQSSGGIVSETGTHVSPGAANAEQSQLTEIVVTAQRREQNLQDVPISVSALTDAAIRASGITGTSTLQAAVPSLNIVRQANGALPYLRGIGSTLGDANAESSVAIYVDGVYQASAFGNFFDFNDIERVEVLKGPQGTLFGRNSTGGVIQVITKDPSRQPDAEISIGYGNFRTVTTNAYVSVPVTDKIAVNTSILYRDRGDGWGSNLTTGEGTPGAGDLSLRSKVLYQVDDATSVRLAGNFNKTHDCGICAQAPDVPNSTTSVPFPGKWNSTDSYQDQTRIESYGGSLHLDHDFGTIRFASISAYQRTYGFWTVDFDLTAADIFRFKPVDSSKTVSQEFHLLSANDSKLQWVLGAFYYHRDAGWDPQFDRGLAFAPLPNGLDAYGNTKTESKSLFAQSTYPILHDTNITLGFRESWEKSDGTTYTTLGGTDFIIDPPGTIPGTSGVPFTNSFSYSKPTWRISLDHKFATDVLGYISYNRGIKSGNFTISAGPEGMTKPYLPEQLDAYEIGIKSEFLDHRVRLNGAIFYYGFKDYQYQRISGGTSFIFNGGDATLYGGELEIEARATEHLTLTGNIGLLQSKVGDFPNAPGSCLTPPGPPTFGASSGPGFACDPTTGFQTTTPFNAKGQELPNAPKFTGNVGFKYDQPTLVGNFGFSGNIYHFDGAAADFNRLRYPKYTTVSASAGWTDLRGVLNIRLWGKNLSNAYYYNQLTYANGLSDLGSPAEPRTYGITVGYKFR